MHLVNGADGLEQPEDTDRVPVLCALGAPDRETQQALPAIARSVLVANRDRSARWA
jgi:hypothetical protein